ncbi:hypothetical protein M8818_003238 [Zalaria obscura]|uniref:Uncharacterized protein n=1 Tax=Zalaria obscura TaxID=2024903 RepID=A0ACC3SFE0_9PEZI
MAVTMTLTRSQKIYATSEERKQRNRQAQAAFRERRTEYIKQLETTIKHHEDTLQNLQQSHRSAADECLMLRYKNSLLERILLEKGIDVQAELQAKTGSPALGPAYMPPHVRPPMGQTPLQRTAMSQQHARRAGQPPFGQAMGPGMGRPLDGSFSARSPQGHPTPSSHASSPNAMSTHTPPSIPQGQMTPPTSAVLAQPQQYRSSQPQPPRPAYMMQQRPAPPSQYPSSNSTQTGATMTGSTAPHGPTTGSTAYYPSPFQKHIDQLGKLPQQEYDAAPHQPPSIVPDAEQPTDTSESASVAGAQQQQDHAQQYHHQFPNHPPMQHPQMQKIGPDGQPQPQEGGPFMAGNQMFDPYDPMLDADPFGLSASMHFPTNYAFDQPPQR